MEDNLIYLAKEKLYPIPLCVISPSQKGGPHNITSPTWEDQIISLKDFLNFPNLAVAPIGPGINRWGHSSQFDSGKRIPNKWTLF